MRYFVFVREEGNEHDFIANLETMEITEDIRYAQQISEDELENIDIAYMNQNEFFATDISTYGVSYLPALHYHPPRGFRPPPPPPRRRYRRRPAPPPLGAILLGAMLGRPRPPMRRPSRGPGRPPRGGMPGRPARFGRGPGGPGRRGPGGPGGRGPGGPARRGPGGPGGRGPGRGPGR